jgi:acyl-CoA thioester hydrolase
LFEQENRPQGKCAVQHPLLSGFPVIVEVPVVWGEMDSYRHVNNVVYFRYFETARLAYFGQMDWFEYEKQWGIGPILAYTQCRFRKPLTYPDTVSIAARVSSLAVDRFTMEHLVLSHGLEVIAAEGQSTIVSYHYERGNKMPLPEELHRRMANLEAKVGNQIARAPERGK